MSEHIYYLELKSEAVLVHGEAKMHDQFIASLMSLVDDNNEKIFA